KGDVKIEPMTTAAARAAGRPVRLELSREEVFFTVAKHSSQVFIRTGVTDDGLIVARRMNVRYNAGAYSVTSPRAAGQGMVRAPGPYHMPNVWVDSTTYFTNTVPTGPFRGAMTSQVAWAHESQLDDIAADLGIDPLELRRRNHLRNDDVYATGEKMHDLFYAEILDSVAAGVDWGSPSEPSPPGTARGKGLAIMIKSTYTPSRSEARLELVADGSATIWTSSVEMGQGAHATLAQMGARELGLAASSVRVSFTDTDVTPFDTSTASSRTTYSMGNAVRSAARALKTRLAELVAEHRGVAEDAVVVAGGRVVIGDGGDALSYADALALTGRTSLAAEGVFQSTGGLGALDPETGQGPATVHWHQGGASAEVEVDLETGVVTVLRMHGAAYAGRMVSPSRVRQQNEGCAIFALGPAMLEELLYDDGQMVNPNFSDYMIPSIHDIPRQLTSEGVEHPDPDTDLHGVGEMVVPAVAPAIGNAIRDAVGTRIRALPMTPERVLRALGEDKRIGGSE
ncbi:MAG: molybdopterin-dependent oxidoreductase, partial [Nitriliruptorales bacterium]|nr:molybdopterin-dependent oxidoreductase [Nitriliruptorales bacterium]